MEWTFPDETTSSHDFLIRLATHRIEGRRATESALDSPPGRAADAAGSSPLSGQIRPVRLIPVTRKI